MKLRSKRFRGSGCIFALLFFLAYGAACAQLDRAQKENKANTMREQQSSAVVYTALGDSTGVGVGAKEGGGYVARLFERIKRERNDARLINLCVSGATTEDVLREQMRAALATRPTLVTIGIGINDIGHGMSVAQFERNYEEIIKKLKAETKATIVVTNVPDISFAPVVPLYARDSTRRNVQLFNEKIQAIAERHDLLLVDVYSETHRVIPTHPEFFSEDGFHPSTEGYEYWAETMWPTVKAAINK
jgi:acyl-CoA thioesterase I